jgi:hypothetical protein
LRHRAGRRCGAWINALLAYEQADKHQRARILLQEAATARRLILRAKWYFDCVPIEQYMGNAPSGRQSAVDTADSVVSGRASLPDVLRQVRQIEVGDIRAKYVNSIPDNPDEHAIFVVHAKEPYRGR